MTTGPPQKNIKILLENEVFTPANSKSTELPCRRVWDLVIYDSKNSMTKLEDLSEKGPFTAVAVAKDASEVKQEYVGCTVIISPIVEYSMEFPYGKEAIVWLRSNRAFYRVMSVNPSYEAVWTPLKSLLDISGHVINVMLKTTLDQLSIYIIKKIADLAAKSLQETIALISSGRAFIIEQIKNQNNPKLFKYQFFKDLSSAKSWFQFKNLVESEAASSAKKAIKLKTEEPKPATKESKELKESKEPVAKSKSGKASPPDQIPTKATKASSLDQIPTKTAKASPPDPIPTKTTKASSLDSIPTKTSKSKSETATRPKRILEPQESEEDIFPSSAKARKNSGKSSSALRKPIDQKPLVVTPPKIQKAKRTDTSKSIFTPNLINVDLPSESDFEFRCPYCGLVLQKSQKLTSLLPRVRIHLQLHSFNADIDESFRGLSFSERFTKFTEKMSRDKDEEEADDEDVEQSVLQWPKRELPTTKMDIDEPPVPIAVVEVPIASPLKVTAMPRPTSSAVPSTAASSSSVPATMSSASTSAPKASVDVPKVAVPVVPNVPKPVADPKPNNPAVASIVPPVASASKLASGPNMLKIPRQLPADPKTVVIDVVSPRPGFNSASPLTVDVRASPLKQPSVGSRASPVKRALVGSGDHLSNAYARVTAPLPTAQKDKDQSATVRPPPHVPAPLPATKLAASMPADLRSTPFAASRVGSSQVKPAPQHRPPPVPAQPYKARTVDITAFKPSDFPSNPPPNVQRNMSFSAIDLTADTKLSKSPVKSIDLCDTDDSTGVIGSRLNRLPDVRVDKCWRCGFRVTSRVCSQCESVQ